MADDVKLLGRPSTSNSHTPVSPQAAAASHIEDGRPEQVDIPSSACFSGLSSDSNEEAETTCGLSGLANTITIDLIGGHDGNHHHHQTTSSILSRPLLPEGNSENIQPSPSSSSPLSDPGDSSMRRILTSLFRELRTYAVSNIEYFQNGKQSYHARLQVAFALLCEHIDAGIEPQLDVILPNLSRYDVCPEIPANGYRSLLKIIQKCCLHLLQLCRHITINRDSVLFRIVHYARELECYVAVLGQLRACLYFSCQLMAYCPKDSLFIDKDGLKDPIAFRLLKEFDSLGQDCFYGRCLGFQFCDSMRKPLLGVVVAMASFSEGYHETSNIMKVACSLLSSGKYILDPELRARQVVHVARNSDIQFCKSFWSLLENDFSSHLPLLSGFMVQVNSIITLTPLTVELPARDPSKEKTVKISPPSVYTGTSSVQFRLISSDYREGQEMLLQNLSVLRTSSKSKPPSRNLLFHIHGGGFVAQSSKSHEVYLRQWARDLKVPIISIDYSLAPENPFPRAIEECFYMYAWALKNSEQLGWTGERICFAGDSAGGNLTLAVTIHAIRCNIRVPDGILGVYPSVLISLVPSPSRLLSVMDPLLPVGIMLKCLDAYIGTATVSDNYGQTEEEKEENCDKSAKETVDKSNLSFHPEFSSCPATPMSDNERLHLEAKDLENNVLEQPNTFLNSDIGDLFGTSNSQSPSEKSDYSTPQGLSPVKISNNQTQLPSQGDGDDWDDLCNVVIPQSMPLIESEDIVFSQFSDQTPDTASVDNYSSVRQQLFKSSFDSGISLNDNRPRNCDKTFVSEPNLELNSPPPVSGLSSVPNPISHSVSTPTFHARRPEDVNIRRPHLTSFEPQNVQKALERFLKQPVIKNPLVSPIYASDEQLRMFPEISLVTCDLDPLLDDSVQLCKRMRQLGKIADLTVLEDLPHGFLNFALISKEARHGSNTCVSKLRKLLQIT